MNERFHDETLTLSGLAVAQGHAVPSKRDHLRLVLYVKVIQGCFLELVWVSRVSGGDQVNDGVNDVPVRGQQT